MELRSLPQDQLAGEATAVPGEKLHMPSAAALKGVARTELRALAAALRKTGPGQSVHGARRRIKRLRSLLRLLRAPLGEEAFQTANDCLRSAANSLAGQRRAEALVVAAARIGGRRAHTPWVQLAEEHRAAQVSGHEGESGPEAALKSVEAAAIIVGPLKLKAAAQDIEGAFMATYRKARKLLGRGFASGYAEDLHTARKHVIHHIHQLDLLRAHVAHPGNRLSELDALREALGDLNDLDELCQLAAGGPTVIPEPAVRAAAKRRAMLLKQAERAADRLFRQKAKTFQKRIGVMRLKAQG